MSVIKQQRDLEDAQVALARYNRMCLRLTLVFVASVLGLGDCALLLSLGAGAEMWLIGVPVFAAGVASFVAFINTVIVANENRHPADRVREAQHALDDAKEEELDRLAADAESRAAAALKLGMCPEHQVTGADGKPIAFPAVGCAACQITLDKDLS